MIDLVDVSEQFEIYGRTVELLRGVDFHLPAGRYALLSRTPDLHRPLIDILAGTKTPTAGQVLIPGSISWPIGRQGFVRGRMTGRDVIDLVGDLYDVDREYTADIVTMLISRPDYVDERIERWPPYVRREFTFALALVPEFDTYVIDAPLPFEESRFTRLWQALFEERLVGKSLILATYRQKQMLDYCAKGLIYDRDGFRIEHDLDGCIEQFPSRPVREEPGGDELAGIGDGAEFSF